jgi:hypothetical protein
MSLDVSIQIPHTCRLPDLLLQRQIQIITNTSIYFLLGGYQAGKSYVKVLRILEEGTN